MSALEAVGGIINGAIRTWVLGTNAFYARMPDNPSVCLGIYEYEGASPLETFADGGFILDRPKIQVKVRAGRDDYDIARDATLAIRTVLKAVTDGTYSGVRILRVQPLGAVLPLGSDVEERPIVAANFQLTTGVV